MMGTAIGLFIGLVMAAFFEIPRLFKIQNIEDAKHYTGLPILASVPPLLSEREKDWLRRSAKLKLAAGIAGAIAIIPLIVLLLQVTRVFDRLVS